jgi:hypothetical protein
MRNVYSIGAGFLPASFKPVAQNAPVEEVESDNLDLILESVELIDDEVVIEESVDAEIDGLEIISEAESYKRKRRTSK